MPLEFHKNNPHPNNPKALNAEADGLQALASLITELNLNLRVPKIIKCTDQTLSLQYIKSNPPSKTQWQTLGTELAKLHSHPQNQWGYRQHNYIGLNPQSNGIHSNWGEFFYQQRLLYQVSLINNNQLKTDFTEQLISLKPALIDFLNNNSPQISLLHGDLWSGNVMFSHEHIWLIDPAVYWGDSEADMAMTELFGGFAPAFYQAYHSHLPRSTHYLLKKTCYNLYHYLNHYNLFGDSYLVTSQDSMKRLKSALIEN